MTETDAKFFTYWDEDANSKKTITYHPSAGHIQKCVGEECTEISSVAPHRFETWIAGASPSYVYAGYKYRNCRDCGYKDYSTIPKLVEAHEHDFRYDYVSSADSHWGQYECAKEDMTTMEPHQFGDWACEDCGKIMVRLWREDSIRITDYYHPGYYYNITPVTPTCTSTGVSMEQICTQCDKLVLRSKTLPKLPHEWEEVEEVSATCTTKGTVFHYQCANCDAVSLDGEKELRNIVRLVNTAFSEHKWAVAADTGEKECMVCGKSQESVEEKVSHIYGKTRCRLLMRLPMH